MSLSPSVSAFRLASFDRPAERSATEEDRAAGYAAGWAAGARAAAEHVAKVTLANQDTLAVAESRRSAEVARVLDLLGRAAADANARFAPAVTEVRAALLVAALELAEALIGVELSDAETSAKAALVRALSAPAELGVHTVRISVHDHATLVAAGIELPEGVAVVADSRLRPGDSISEYPGGSLDAQIAVAVQHVRDALAEVSR